MTYQELASDYPNEARLICDVVANLTRLPASQARGNARDFANYYAEWRIRHIEPLAEWEEERATGSAGRATTDGTIRETWL